MDKTTVIWFTISGSTFKWKKDHMLFCLQRMPNICLNSTHKKVPNAKLIFDLAINKQSAKFSLGKSVCDLQSSNKSPSVHDYAITLFGAFLYTNRTCKQVHTKTVYQRVSWVSLFQPWSTNTLCPHLFKVPDTMLHHTPMGKLLTWVIHPITH